MTNWQVDIGHIDPKVAEAVALEACRERVDEFKALRPPTRFMDLLVSHFAEPPSSTPEEEGLRHAALAVFQAARNLPAETRNQTMRDLLTERLIS